MAWTRDKALSKTTWSLHLFFWEGADSKEENKQTKIIIADVISAMKGILMNMK